MGSRGLGVLLAAAIGLAGLAGAPRAGAETLADTLALAYRNSNILDQNRAVLRAADEDVADAVSILRPVIAWVADGDYVSTRFTDGFSASLALTAQLVLYDFGRTRTAIDIAKESVLATRQALVGAEQDILLQAVQAYFDLRGAIERVAINENSVRVNDETLRATRDQAEFGVVTRTDVALAEAELASARAGLAAAEGDLASAREAYRLAVGQFPGTLAPAPRAPALPATVDAAQAVAQRNHPAIRQAQHEVTVADLQVALAVANRRPSLNGTASVEANDDGSENASIGIRLSQTIYQGGALASFQRKAIAGRDGSRAALLQTARGIAQGVGNAWSAIAVARAQISAIDEQVVAAEIGFNGVREEALLGARTSIDVLTAEQNLLDARAAKIDAEANLQVAIYSLLASMGLLTVDHLNLGVPVYDPAAYYEAVRKGPATSVQGESLDRVLRAIGGN
ncbi:MAG: transporter [Alphaproteobacteria bacterium HGW-Alphaproteobacteria-6]|nr:MAG: transporter [Alphaproteobacteria bacterium HGW-Alphaproteobacteria-6]